MSAIENTLFLIPARGGSKGIPKKNIKPLGGKPLIHFSIELAREFVPDEQICLSTDSQEIKVVAEQIGLEVPFLRPASLATDGAGTYEVILHAVEYYRSLGREFDHIILLQPTSPFRIAEDIQNCLDSITPDTDMVFTVKETSANPYYLLYEEDENGWLQKSKNGKATRRQDVPAVFEVNGAVYLLPVRSLIKYAGFGEFQFRKKVLMPEERSLDLDSELDWKFAEFLIEEKQ